MSWMYSNFGQIGCQTTELAALERPKKCPHWVIMGKWCLQLFLVV